MFALIVGRKNFQNQEKIDRKIGAVERAKCGRNMVKSERMRNERNKKMYVGLKYTTAPSVMGGWWYDCIQNHLMDVIPNILFPQTLSIMA